jgi:anti-anti-sigma regulatory factor
MAQPLRHQIKLEQIDQGLAFFSVKLEGDLTAASAKGVTEEMKTRVEKFEGRPFGLLFDLRAVTSCDEGGAGAMQAIELNAADKGLEVVSHLVKNKKLVEEARKETAAVGAEKLFGTFDDETAARRFAAGIQN